MASQVDILRIWILCMVILGIFVYIYMKRPKEEKKEGFQLEPDPALTEKYKELLDISQYTNVETEDVLYVAQGDPFQKRNPYDGQVFSSPLSRRIQIHVPPRVPPRCSLAPASSVYPTPKPACPAVPGEIVIRVDEIMGDWDKFEQRFKAIIDSSYKGDRDEARRDFLREARAVLFQNYPLDLAQYALTKYKGDTELAREAILFETDILQEEFAKIKDGILLNIKTVAWGYNPNLTNEAKSDRPSDTRVSLRLAAYALAKYKEVVPARTAIEDPKEREILETERIRIDYNSIMSQQDLSGVSQLVSDVMFPKTRDIFQTTFPKSMAIYALAVYEMNVTKAREALFSNYNGLQADFTTKMDSPAEREEWAKNPRAKTCERLQNLTDYFNRRKADVGTNLVDLSGAATAMSMSKRENKKFQYMFEKVCAASLKKSPNERSPSETYTFNNCIRMASVDPILFPMLKQYNIVSGALYTAEEDFGTVLGAFDKIRNKLKCTSATGLPTFSLTDFGEDDQGYPTMDPGTSAAIIQEELLDLSPYYLAPEILDFVTKYLLGSTEIDEANATINTYLDGTDDNRALTYGIILKMTGATPK